MPFPMDDDMFAPTIFGQIALKKMSPTDANFRLYSAGWLGKGDPRNSEVMEVTGCIFRPALRGQNKGKLTIRVPDTTLTVHVTRREMTEFEEDKPATARVTK